MSSSPSSPNRSALDKKKQQAARSSPSKVAVGRTYVPQSTELTRSLQSLMAEAGPLVAPTSLTTYIASIHAALLKRHPTWNVPQRRTTKFVKRLQSNDTTSDLQSVDSSRSGRRRSFSWRNNNKSNNSADDDAASVGSRGSLRRLFGRNSGSSKNNLAVPPVETVPASKSAQAEPLPSLLSPTTPTQTEDKDDLLLPPPSTELTKSTSSSAEDNEVVSTEESEPTAAEETTEPEQELDAADRSLALAEDEEEENNVTSQPSSSSNSHFYRTTTVVVTVALVAAACWIGLARHGARK